MRNEPTRPESSSWWLAPAAVILFLMMGLGVYWVPGDAAPVEPPVGVSMRVVPPPIIDPPAGLHAVAAGEEEGVRVLRIQVVPGGDELVVDAATGRLLESRPAGRPTTPPGKPRLFAP
jgi:hypothetical protein